ncbi:MAG TPA: hypothetical protein VGE19_11735 [Pseudoxanthomonas sp.]
MSRVCTAASYSARTRTRSFSSMRVYQAAMRHADAGYDIAVQCAKEQGLKLPMV